MLALVLCTVLNNSSYAEPQQSLASIYDLTVTGITGKKVELKKYRGMVLLIANTASKCGFTPQYHDLQELYAEYHDRGLEILGFPSNDFNNQDPGSNSEILHFCTEKFHVTFPLFEKNPVSGTNIQPLFRLLTQDSGDEFKGDVGWNFEKFLVDRRGKLRFRYGSFINPQSSVVKRNLEALLSESK